MKKKANVEQNIAWVLTGGSPFYLKAVKLMA